MQTSSLTTGELPDHLALISAFKVKASQIGTRWHFKTADSQQIRTVGNRIKHRLGIRQGIAGLVDKRNLDGLTDVDLATVRLVLTGDHTKQCRFTSAVGTNDANNRTWWDAEADIVHQ